MRRFEISADLAENGILTIFVKPSRPTRYSPIVSFPVRSDPCANPSKWQWNIGGVILLRRNASELLGFPTASGLNLPAVDIPAHGRAAQALNAQIKARWGLDVYSLYPLPSAEPSGATARYYVTEALQQEPPVPPEARWISVGDLQQNCFAEVRDFAAIRKWIDNLADGMQTAMVLHSRNQVGSSRSEASFKSPSKQFRSRSTDTFYSSTLVLLSA